MKPFFDGSFSCYVLIVAKKDLNLKYTSLPQLGFGLGTFSTLVACLHLVLYSMTLIVWGSFFASLFLKPFLGGSFLGLFSIIAKKDLNLKFTL